jgi:hypothetical protein
MKKVESLYPKVEMLPKNANIFEKELFKKQHETESGNGSVKYTTSGNIFLDDFANLGNYKTPREYEDVCETMKRLWAVDPLTTLKETFYIRMITRQPITLNGEKLNIHRGQGLKSEFQHRMLWLAQNHPGTFSKNVALIIPTGSWNDLFEILRLDLSYNGINKSFDWTPILNLIYMGLEDENQSNLVKKYLPTIHSSSHCTTLRQQCNSYIGRLIAKDIFGSHPISDKEKANVYASYRRMKSSGTAHSWQQLISKKNFDRIDFSKIAGRALQQLTNSKFLENHNLEDAYAKWILSQPTAKYTGYVYELFKPVCSQSCWRNTTNKNKLKKYQQDLLNKQFLGLIDTAKKDMNRKSNFIGVLDISSSMTSEACGTGMSSYQVGLAMCLYFSYLLEGKFKDTFLTFSDNVEIEKFYGDTPLDKFCSFDKDYYGSTNFVGVAHFLAKMKMSGYKEEDFPTGILCLSDGEFNRNHSESSFVTFKRVLRSAGFSDKFVDDFKIVLWDIRNGYYGEREKATFESLADEPNFFYMSGLDPAGIAFLTGTTRTQSIPKTAEELFEAAMNQELFDKIKL